MLRSTGVRVAVRHTGTCAVVADSHNLSILSEQDATYLQATAGSEAGDLFGHSEEDVVFEFLTIHAVTQADAMSSKIKGTRS